MQSPQFHHGGHDSQVFSSGGLGPWAWVNPLSLWVSRERRALLIARILSCNLFNLSRIQGQTLFLPSSAQNSLQDKCDQAPKYKAICFWPPWAGVMSAASGPKGHQVNWRSLDLKDRKDALKAERWEEGCATRVGHSNDQAQDRKLRVLCHQVEENQRPFHQLNS